MIVLAENQEDRKQQFLELLNEMGKAVTVVSTAKELVWTLQNTSLHLLVLSPDLTGIGDKLFDLIRKVRTRYSKQEMPLLLSGMADRRKSILKGYQSGINGLIDWPLDREMAREQLKLFLALRKEYDDLRLQFGKSQTLRNQIPFLDQTVRMEIAQPEQDLPQDQTLAGTLMSAQPWPLFPKEDEHLPCEVPMSLITDERSAMGKTIWLSRRELLVQTSEDLPWSPTLKIRLLNPRGGKVELDGVEIKRQAQKGIGGLKLNIKVVSARDDFETMLTRLREAVGQREGSDSQTRKATGKEFEALKKGLDELLQAALSAKSPTEAREALEKMIAFLNQHKTDGDVTVVDEIQAQVSGREVIEGLLNSNMHLANLEPLKRFFTLLGSGRVVTPLLYRFQKEPEVRKKHWVGELIMIGVGREVMPLVDYGLELPDRDAHVLLRCFGRHSIDGNEAVFLRWSLHQGFQTQMELLKILRILKNRDTEVLNILNLYANGNGSLHPKVRKAAESLLKDRLTWK